jgi:hypothetical protein
MPANGNLTGIGAVSYQILVHVHRMNIVNKREHLIIKLLCFLCLVAKHCHHG